MFLCRFPVRAQQAPTSYRVLERPSGWTPLRTVSFPPAGVADEETEVTASRLRTVDLSSLAYSTSLCPTLRARQARFRSVSAAHRRDSLARCNFVIFVRQQRLMPMGRAYLEPQNPNSPPNCPLTSPRQ